MADSLGDVGAGRASRDILGQLVARGANILLGLVVTVLLVRALDEQGFGQWSTILAVTSIAGLFGDLGLGQVAVRHVAADRERESEWLGALLTLRLALSAISIVVSVGAIAVLAGEGEMLLAGIVLSATMLTSAVSALSVVFKVRVQNDLYARIELVNGVVWAALVIALAALGAGLVAFAVAFVAASVVMTALIAVLALRRASVDLHGARQHWPQLIRVGIPVAVSTILITSYAKIDQIMVFEIAGAGDAGLYGAAYRILDRAVVVPDAVAATLFPLLAAAYGVDAARVRKLVQAGLDTVAVVTLPTLAFAIAAAGPTMRALFGADFEEAGDALAVLMAAYVVSGAGYLAGFLVIVTALQRKFVGYAVAGLVVNVAGNLVLIPQVGYIGAAWMTLATEVVVVGLTLRAVLGEIEHRPSPARLVRIAAASTLTGLAVWAGVEAAAPFAVLVVIAAGVYVPAALLLRAVDRDELRALRAA